MPQDYASRERTAMRRSDRAVDDDAWLRAFLHQAAVGTFATVHDGQPFMNTNLFVYDEDRHCIYLHTARVGRTRANVDLYERVSFSIMAMGRLLPAEEALEFSVEYAGVMIFGRAHIVQDEAEATDALQKLLDKYAPHLTAGQDYRPPVPEELKRTAVFRLEIEDWSGKKKEVEDFPGAYWYPEQPVLESVCKRVTWQGGLAEIYIAPSGGAPVQSVDSVRAVPGRGLEGDRYFEKTGTFSQRAGTGRDVTLFALEDLEGMAADSGVDLSPEQTRRNLMTRGVPLNHLVGKTFRIGEVILRGARLCEPCDTLAKAIGGGNKLLRSMVHRGGLRADIVQGGVIRAGDVICPVIEPE